MQSVPPAVAGGFAKSHPSATAGGTDPFAAAHFKLVRLFV